MAERALRVLVIGNLPPHVLGGAENQVARLVEAWLQSGAHVEVAGHRIPDGRQLLNGFDVQTHHLQLFKVGGRAGRALGYAFSIAKLAIRRRRAFDVVYCRGIGDGVLSFVVLKALKLCRWPIVACPINARGAGDVAFLRSIPGWKLWSRLIDRHVQAINLINASIAEDLNEVGIRRPQLSYIPNGIPIREQIPRATVAAERRLIWTGRLDTQKGLDLLLPALAKCLQEGASFRLELYGEGGLHASLAAQAQALGLSEHVHFHAAVPAEEIRTLLRYADVFVLPSRYEGMSNSALEAMEVGLPVLCTQCGGIDVFIQEDAGWVCEPDSEDALFAALRRMFLGTDEELLRRGRHARSLIEDRFAMTSVAAANLALLESVAAKGSI